MLSCFISCFTISSVPWSMLLMSHVQIVRVMQYCPFLSPLCTPATRHASSFGLLATLATILFVLVFCFPQSLSVFRTESLIFKHYLLFYFELSHPRTSKVKVKDKKKKNSNKRKCIGGSVLPSTVQCNGSNPHFLGSMVSPSLYASKT